jgi:uncharacterized membrane protein
MTLTNTTIGVVHLASAVTAMLLGACVLWANKGTFFHERVGYAYCLSMLIVNITAFGIYRLWGRFGVFHGFALLSLFTLLAGMLPIIWRRNARNISLHLNFMYWSVVGLYCAFVAETLVRVPIPFLKGQLSTAVFIGTFGVMAFGSYFFRIYKESWEHLAQAISGNEESSDLSM